MLVWPSEPAAGRRSGAEPVLPLFVDPSLARELKKQRWYDGANRLSPEGPVSWEIIDEVAVASRKPSSEPRRRPTARMRGDRNAA